LKKLYILYSIGIIHKSIIADFKAIGEKMTALISNDTLEGMSSMGTQIGDFLSNLAPGIFKFTLLLGIAGGIVAIIYAVVTAVTKKISHK
jgi:hypothetical protein